MRGCFGFRSATLSASVGPSGFFYTRGGLSSSSSSVFLLPLHGSDSASCREGPGEKRVSGPGKKRVSDLEGDSSPVLVPTDERVVAERAVLDRAPVERVVAERIASCHPIQDEHRKDSACHLWVDPSKPLDDR